VPVRSVRTRREAAERLAVHRNAVGRWLRHYEQADLDELLQIGQPGAPVGQRTLPDPVFAALKLCFEDPEGFGSDEVANQWLDGEFSLEMPYKTVHKLVRYRLKAKLKRPRHAKKGGFGRLRRSPKAAPRAGHGLCASGPDQFGA
jgi:transposase